MIVSSAFLHAVQPSLPEFHDAFQVVFVDPSGHLNMCADMTACTYKKVHFKKNMIIIFIFIFFFQASYTCFCCFISLQLQHEASVSMQFWDNPTVDGFHSLLMTPKPMIRTSDHVFQYGSMKSL